jgi:tetratricopeptide (TPR) repeat protein
MVEIDKILSERSDVRIIDAVKALSDQDFGRLVERVLGYLELKIMKSRPKGTFVIADCVHRREATKYTVFFSRRDEAIVKGDIESLVSYMARAESPRALVLTISSIADEASKLAEQSGIGLADGSKLVALLRRFDMDKEIVRAADTRKEAVQRVPMPGADARLEDAMAAGYNALADKDHMKALDAFDRAILFDDSYDVPWRMKGNTLDEMGYHEQALECYRHALELLPESDETWFSLGNCFFSLSRYNEEIMCYDRALLYNPTMQKALVNKGSTLHRLGRYPEALETYDRVLKLNYRLEKVHNNRGATLHKLGRTNDALESYGRAIELKHDYAEAWMNRGNSLYELARYDEALEAFTRMTQVRSELPKGWYLKGLVLRKLGKVTQAKAAFEQALKLDPEYIEARRAIEEESRKMAERFVDVPRIVEDIFSSQSQPVQEAVQADANAAKPSLPEDVVARVHEETVEQVAEEVYGDRAELLLLLGRPEEAFEFLGKSLKLEGERADLLTAAGNVLFKQGKLEAAAKTYEHAIAADPKYAPALFNMYSVLVQMGDHERASKVAESLRGSGSGWLSKAVASLDAYRCKDYKRAIEAVEVAATMENLAMLQNMRGMVKLEMGDTDGAVEAFTRALEMPLDPAEGHNNLGVALLRKGEAEKAGTEFDRAIRAQRNYPAAWSNRGCVLYRVERVREAIACFEESLVMAPTTVAMTNKGFCQLSIDVLPDAVQSFEQSIRIAETPEAYNDKGIALKRLGRAPEALVAFNESLRLAPQFKDAMANLHSPVQDIPAVPVSGRSEAAPPGPDPAVAQPAPQPQVPLVVGDEPSAEQSLASVKSEELKAMRKVELEALCASVGLNPRGTKNELVSRLVRFKAKMAKKG